MSDLLLGMVLVGAVALLAAWSILAAVYWIRYRLWWRRVRAAVDLPLPVRRDRWKAAR